MIRILHLLSNDKFIDVHIRRFLKSDFENTSIYLQKAFTYQGEYRDLLQWVIPFSHQFYSIPDLATGYDFVFLYQLDYEKAFLVNRFNIKTVLIWHFYGTEIYNQDRAFRYSIFSSKTKSLLHLKKSDILLDKTIRLLSRIKYKMFGRIPTYDEVIIAMKRINYFAWYSKKEYDLIQSKIKFTLPEFLNMPFLLIDSSISKAGVKDPKAIVLGNSFSPENNHIDILDLLEKTSFNGKVLLPFSYGYYNSKYAAKLKKSAAKKSFSIEYLESFIGYDDYVKLISSCGAAVFNSYRQLALGNIFIAIANGMKVYLNEENPSLGFLNDAGFYIYSVQKDLEKDILKNMIILETHEAEHNKINIVKLGSDDAQKQFFSDLKNIYQKQQE